MRSTPPSTEPHFRFLGPSFYAAAMGSAGGDRPSLMRLFEEALRRAEAEANATRAAGRADAARRIAAAETERREILTATRYQASLVMREADARAAEIRQEAVEIRQRAVHEALKERDRIHRDAQLDAKSIREDAAEEAAKLLAKLNTERDHILADAHDAARRIVDSTDEPAWSDADSLVSQEPSEEAEEPGGTDGETSDVWVVDLDCIFPDEPSVPTVGSGAWKRTRHRRWYQRRR